MKASIVSLRFSAACLLLPAFGLAIAQNGQRVNRDSAVSADFQNRVSQYLKLHKKAQGNAPAPKATNSPTAITEFQHHLADAIRQLRPGARQGDIFTPAIADVFRKLIATEMNGPDRRKVRKSFEHAEPIHGVRLDVNQSYPDNLPLQSMPPSLLLNLPKLPPELEYRFVGRELVLRDIAANLIVDTIPDVSSARPGSSSKP